MTTISLDRVPRIVQGAGALGSIGSLVAELVAPGTPVLLVADPGLKGTGMIETARTSLQGAKLGTILFDDVKSDPTMAQVDAGARLARQAKATAVVSIGGGSAGGRGTVRRTPRSTPGRALRSPDTGGRPGEAIG